VVAPAASAGRFLPRFLSSFLDDLIFFTALLSAALILFSSSESLATSSDKYSSTVFHPPSDLSAICINLFLFLRTANESSNNFTVFRTLFLPSSDNTTLVLPEISAKKEGEKPLTSIYQMRLQVTRKTKKELEPQITEP
jgi:hypothetical protein